MVTTIMLKSIYMEQLNSVQWVNSKQFKLINSSWDNPNWELFHHWVKLSALRERAAMLYIFVFRSAVAGMIA